MNPSRIFILRPVATTLMMLAILLAGGIAYRMLPLSALPEVDYPTIQIITLYPGASPDVMATTVTAPLERQLGQMPGLKQMTSTSSGGASVVTLQFNLELAIDIAEQQVQAAINAAGTFLPADLPTPPIYNKVNPADAPILTLALTSATLTLPQIQDLADTRVAQKISQVTGVGLVSINGGQRPAVRIQANMTALASYGLSLEDIRAAITNNNVNQAKGGFDGPSRAFTIDANDQLRSGADYAAMIVSYRNGAPIRLSDVATVVEGGENNRLAAWANRDPAVILNVQRQPRANVIEVVDRIQALLPQLRQSLPASVELKVLTDRTTTIRAAIKDTQFELLLAIGLVVLVMFLFLRNLTATIIPSVAVPLSLVGTFGVMYLAGFSLNNLSLMALTIATGFVVDDAIVMIENIARYIEKGERPLDAALKGAGQIGFTIISLTVSLIAVLIPLLFMADVVGRLFREFAITLAVTILVSAVVSLTLTPMMCAKLLKQESHRPMGPIARTTERWWDAAIRGYDRSLVWVLNRQGLMLVIAVATLALSVFLYVLVPKGFFPQQDTGLIQGLSDARQTISFQAMAERQQAMADAILQDQAVDSLTSFIGVDGTNPTLNSGRMLINLKPFGERDPADVVIARLQQRAAQVEGISLALQPVQDLTIDDRLGRAAYQFMVVDGDPARLYDWVPKLVERLSQRHELTHVSSELRPGGLAAYVEIDRTTAARLGVTPAAVNNALYNAFGQRIVSTIFTQAAQYRVILEADPSQQGGLEAFGNIYVPGADGAQVKLSTIATITERAAPLTIDHYNQLTATTVSFDVAPHSSLGAAVTAIRETAAELGMPVTTQLRLQGTAAAFETSLSNEVWLILAAIVTMYIVLGVLYESFIHPVTILSTLPSAGVGALLALELVGMDLDVIGLIGIVLLIGIVKKNAIMMIDFALDAERNEGKSPREAIHQACLLRLRPILMTTFAAMFGALPLVMSGGVGAELRQPLGVTIIGGLIVSQMLTLFTTPVIYLAFDRLATRFRRPPEDDADAAEVAR